MGLDKFSYSTDQCVQVREPAELSRVFYPKTLLISGILTTSQGRVLIRHRRSENSPATTWNPPAKLRWPVEASKVNFSLSVQILLLLYIILLLLQFFMKTLQETIFLGF